MTRGLTLTLRDTLYWIRGESMKNISQVSELAGVSKRTLQYYDEIDLLKPTCCTDAGYRLYDDEALARLQQILLYRELQFPLKDIKQILQSSSFNRNRALEEQIRLLTLKKEHLENLILFARGLLLTGGKNMDFSAFDTKKLDEYAAQAKANWGKTAEYQEFEKKSQGRSREEDQMLEKEMMEIFRGFSTLKDGDPASDAAQKLVKELQAFITEHFYACSPRIMLSLGQMYAGGGSFTESIDSACGEGAAAFIHQAIRCCFADEKMG